MDFADQLCKIIPQKHNHFFEILQFYLLHLFTPLDLINDVVDNKRYYPTSAKQDETTLNIGKTGKTKVKKMSLKYFFKKGQVTENLLKIKLIINMLYVVYIQ